MELLGEDEVKEKMRGMVSSRDWWVIPWIGPESGDLSTLIEERYYDGPANRDFQLFTGPLPFATGVCIVSFARKSRMSAEELHGLLIESGVDRSLADAILPDGERDVLIPVPTTDPETRQRASAYVRAWFRWLNHPGT